MKNFGRSFAGMTTEELMSAEDETLDNFKIGEKKAKLERGLKQLVKPSLSTKKLDRYEKTSLTRD